MAEADNNIKEKRINTNLLADNFLCYICLWSSGTWYSRWFAAARMFSLFQFSLA